MKITSIRCTEWSFLAQKGGAMARYIPVPWSMRAWMFFFFFFPMNLSRFHVWVLGWGNCGGFMMIEHEWLCMVCCDGSFWLRRFSLVIVWLSGSSWPTHLRLVQEQFLKDGPAVPGLRFEASALCSPLGGEGFLQLDVFAAALASRTALVGGARERGVRHVTWAFFLKSNDQLRNRYLSRKKLFKFYSCFVFFGVLLQGGFRCVFRCALGCSALSSQTKIISRWKSLPKR